MWIEILILAGIGAVFLSLWFWMQRQMKLEKERLHESFKALSFDVFEQNSQSFLNLAKMQLEKYQEGAKNDLEGRQKSITQALDPLNQMLKKLEEHQRELEKKREGAYSSLHKQIEMMMTTDRELRQETSQLVQALRSPHMRGSWGQVHLRRVVELAGLVNQCDFFEQVTIESDGKISRPDLVIHLPGQRQIVVDAKTPLQAYLEAFESQDEKFRYKKLQEHAVHLRKHIKDLSSKDYWKSFDRSLEYVILFLPAEAIFSAALQVDPLLIEIGAEQNVIVATPTTLIAILRAVAYGWKQESLSKSAKEIAQVGSELYDRLGVLCDHWNKVGRQLGLAVDSFNQSVASLESRVFVSARKLKEYHSITKEFPESAPIEKLVRSIKTEETSVE